MSNQTDPRIAKKEMIITRTKSAQQKRKLREKDRSSSNITQLLKSPINRTYKNSRKKLRTTENRSSDKSNNTVTNNLDKEGVTKEYYPDKLRRRFEAKRNFLKPKYKSHTVVKLNKRKLGTPQRGMTLEDMQSPSQSEEDCLFTGSKTDVFADLSMEEVVRIVEETESLDDEDLMEILTCPSPVWWEDPPNENYIEDAIYTKKPERIQNTSPNPKKSRREKAKSLPKDNVKKDKRNDEKPRFSDIYCIVKKNDKFLKKRSKLENVLGNIKNKVTIGFDNVTDKVMDEKICDITEESNGSTEDSIERRKEKRNSESTESFPDLNFSNEEMLRDLENMDIPIEVSCKDKDNLIEEREEDDKESTSTEIEKKSESATEDIRQTISLAPNVPLNLPRLTKRPKLELQESPSVKSLSDETELSSVSGQENIDTISDTNIKFIIDEDIEMTDNDSTDPLKQVNKEIDTDDINNSKLKATTEVLKALSDKKEFITVYKIVSNDQKQKSSANKFKNIPEYSNYVENLMKEETSDDFKCNGQLNSFFKKCKFVNRKKNKESDKEVDTKEAFCDTCEPKKCITVAQDENVKYCLNCSSIFDTDDCSYCLKSKIAVKDKIEDQT